MADRVAIFIDAGYFEHVARGTSVDYEKIAAELAGGSPILRTYYYNCPPYQSRPPTEDERRRQAGADRFYARLKRISKFQVRLGRLAKRSCRDCNTTHFQQKRVDILLGVDMVLLAAKQAIQEAILVAGDSDFIPAITAAKSEGVLIKLYHGAQPHSDLRQEADERIRINQTLVDSVRRQPDLTSN